MKRTSKNRTNGGKRRAAEHEWQQTALSLARRVCRTPRALRQHAAALRRAHARWGTGLEVARALEAEAGRWELERAAC